MTEILWKLLAFVVSREPVANYLIKRAAKTPYFNLEGYMNRDWLFNGYNKNPALPEAQRHERPIKWLPSIRVHHILREDHARDPHSHPWNKARTIILKGWYNEDRLEEDGWCLVRYLRMKGDTATLNHDDFHNIVQVGTGGVVTLFFTWDYVGTWGFLTDRGFVPHNEYKDGGAA
jgi:hypothetical protein